MTNENRQELSHCSMICGVSSWGIKNFIALFSCSTFSSCSNSQKKELYSRFWKGGRDSNLQRSLHHVIPFYLSPIFYKGFKNMSILETSQLTMTLVFFNSLYCNRVFVPFKDLSDGSKIQLRKGESPPII